MRERATSTDAPGSAAPAAVAPLSLAAFSAVVDQWQAALFGFLQGMLGDAEQARDLTQDTFHDAWRATQALAPPWSGAHDDDERRRWLFHAAYCDAASALRRGALIRWEPLNADDAREPRRPAPGRPFEDTVAERLALDAALATLRPEDAACLLLSALQGFTAQEIGQIIDASTEATKKRLARAKRRLRDAYIALNRDEESRP